MEAGPFKPILQNWMYSRPNIGILMECGDNPLQKDQQFQELVVQNCAITFLNCITKNCYTLYRMPYRCIDGTSSTSCIVACERAMSCIQSGVDLWQANTSTIDTMPYFVNFNTFIRDTDFCHILQYLSWWMSMTAPLKKPETPHIREHPSLQNWPCYKHLLKSSWRVMWIPWRLQMADQKLHCATEVARIQGCSQDLLVSHLHSGTICQWLGPCPHSWWCRNCAKNASHHYMVTWLPEECEPLFCLLTCLPIDCKFLVSMHLAKTCTTFGL